MLCVWTDALHGVTALPPGQSFVLDVNPDAGVVGPQVPGDVKAFAHAVIPLGSP